MATVKKEKPEKKISITMTELVLQNIDRSRADLKKWWYALQNGEQITYPNRSQLYDLCERIIHDGHLSGLMEKRITAMLNKELHYEIKGKRVDEMEDLIQSDKFRLMMRILGEKKRWGLSGLEFLTGSELDFVMVPRKHIKPESKIIAYEQNGWEGIDYTGMWNILIVEDVERFGLLNKSIPLVLLKTGSLSDLAQYIEMYGQPIRKGTYPGDDPEAKAELKRALKEAGASLSLVLPEGTTVEIIGDHVTTGNGEVHKVLLQTINNELSILWLGNVETTSNDNGGSNAKAKEQGKQQDELIKSDLKDMADMLSSDAMKTILKSYGYKCAPGDGGKFVFEKEIDLEVLKNKKDVWLAVSAKVPVAPDDWYNTFDIPKPENFDELYAKMEEERVAKLNPPDPPVPGKPIKEKKVKKPLSAEESLTRWEAFRLWAADFFVPGHKD